jgi:hypothetical protein
VAATAVAAVLSGAPSTVHALATGADPLAAARAAGTILPGGRSGLAPGVMTHAVISAFWGAVLAVILPRRAAAVWGAVAGLGIAAFDLGVVARLRPLPAITALPPIPQVADHVAFGAITGALLDR